MGDKHAEHSAPSASPQEKAHEASKADPSLLLKRFESCLAAPPHLKERRQVPDHKELRHTLFGSHIHPNRNKE